MEGFLPSAADPLPGSPSPLALLGEAGPSSPASLCTSMGASDPLPLAVSVASDSSTDVEEPVHFLEPSSALLLPAVFKAANSLTEHDRLAAVEERAKNQKLLDFILGHGFSIEDLNEFTQSGKLKRNIDENGIFQPWSSQSAREVFDEKSARKGLSALPSLTSTNPSNTPVSSPLPPVSGFVPSPAQQKSWCSVVKSK